MDSEDEDFIESGSESDFDGVHRSHGAPPRPSPPPSGGNTSTAHPSSSTNPNPKPDPRLKHLVLAKCLPYPTESLEEMDARLEHIAGRLVDCVEAGERDDAFNYWTRRLQNWISLRYPMKKSMRVNLAAMFYEFAVMPGVEPIAMGIAAEMVMSLLRPRKLVGIKDLRLPWRPLHDMLAKELFPKRRKAGHTNISSVLLDMAEVVQRFFHPSEYEEMLTVMLPRLHGDDIDSILATQAFITHFLPYSHPQLWLPAMFKIWEGINSGLYDEQMLDLLARLSVKHVNPKTSDPKRLESIPHTEVNDTLDDADIAANADDDDEDAMDVDVDKPSNGDGGGEGEKKEEWQGIRKEIGILTEKEFQMVMTKCLRAMGTPVGGAVASSAAAALTPVDSLASRNTLTMRKPTSRLYALAEIIVYSLAEDAPARDSSSVATPGAATPMPSAINRLREKAVNGLHPSLSTDSLADAGRRAEASKTYLGGSKALEHLSKLILSCESFFHPSNQGAWTQILATFIQDLGWLFLKRWKEEESAQCKTPQAWRLTTAIRREFVLTLRTVALMSMFAKDQTSQGASRNCLKYLSVLEAELIIPPIIERAVPSLTGLEQTHRTNAVIKALGGISFSMVNRSMSRSGTQHLAGLLELMLAGIDMNDPGKTISTVVFLMGVLQYIRLEPLPEDVPEGIEPGPRTGEAPDDLAVDVKEDQMEDIAISQEERDQLLRQSTSMFSTWISDLIGRIFQLYDNMPEEGDGRSIKAGISSEERVVAAVNSLLVFTLTNLSHSAAERVIDQIYDHVTTSVRTNSLRVISGLIVSLSDTHPAYTLKKFVPTCSQRIKSELNFGASSVRTIVTTVPVAADAALHWNIALLLGACSGADVDLLPYKDEILDVLSLLVDKTYAEAGWSWTGRLVEKLMGNLGSTFVKEGRLVNPDVWESDDFKYNHHLYWGKTYRLSEVKVDWHVPSEIEIRFIGDILHQVLTPCMDRLEKLLEVPAKDLVWNNDFCRNLSHVRYSLSAMAELWQEFPDLKTGAEEHRGAPNLPYDFVERPKPFASGFSLADPSTSDYKMVASYRERFGHILHRAVAALKDEGGESSIDAIRLTVRSIGTLISKYGVDQKRYSQLWKNHSYLEKQSRIWAKQKPLPRYIWIKRMDLYHAARLRLNAQRRKRSAMDDLLIKDLVNMSLSAFVKIRKSAQSTLSSVTTMYDGLVPMVIPLVLPALNPGTDPDVMKGALYVLAFSSIMHQAVEDPRFIAKYYLALLQSQHQEKPSIQALVASLLEKAIGSIHEPMTLTMGRNPSADAEAALKRLTASLASGSLDIDLREQVRAGVAAERQAADTTYEQLIPKLLAVAEDPSTHWRYTVTTARLMRHLLRRDLPADPRVGAFFMSKISDHQPALRAHAQLAITRILYLIKLRTLCFGSEEALFLQEGQNPLKRTIVLSADEPGFTEGYLRHFRDSVDDAAEDDQWMQDKSSVGWLCWGEKITQTRLAKWDEHVFDWEQPSREAIEAMRVYVDDPAWWRSLVDVWGQEKSRKHLAADNIDVLRSICQIYGNTPFQHLKPIMEQYLEVTEKDKQRALAEVLSGILRGMKHWPGSARAEFWEWLTPRLPKIYGSIRPDTFEYWKICFEHVLYKRDPRRMRPLLDFLLEVGRSADYANASAFELKKATQMINSVIRCLAWRFESWSDEFTGLYFGAAIDNSYVDVRSLVASNIELLDNVRWHPSYPSARKFLQECIQFPNKDIIGIVGHHHQQLNALLEQLPQLREERPSGAKAALSKYDTMGSTILRWLYSGLSDTHAPAIFGYILPILPEVFQMREMVDSDDLHKMAAFLLVFVVAVTPPIDLVEPLIHSLLKTLKESPSWKVRLHALPILSIVYYRELPLVNEELATKIMDVLANCMHDDNQEVREVAAATLSGVLRCSQRASINVLKDRFVREIKSVKLPRKRDQEGTMNPAYQGVLIKLHAAVLGVTAIIEAFPYTIPKFLPYLLTEVLAEHASDPTPISSTVRACAANFQRTHADTWHEDKLKFSDDQLSNLTYVISGTSYYA